MLTGLALGGMLLFKKVDIGTVPGSACEVLFCVGWLFIVGDDIAVWYGSLLIAGDDVDETKSSKSSFEVGVPCTLVVL